MAAFGGVFVMFSLGIVTPAHWVQAAQNLWTPFVAIASIMVITDVARRAGLLEWWARSIDVRASSTPRLFFLVFALGAATSTAFNNDAAILLLTPLILALARRRFPDCPEMALPFAFAVFMSAGVAALPVSNPMNMVVAEFMGISFNEYANHMIPIAVAGWIVGFVVLWRIFADQLTTPMAAAKASSSQATTMQRLMIVLLVCVLASYPLFGSVGGPVWVVAAMGAMFSLLLARHHLGISPFRLVREGVSWETLVFLCAVLIMALGLKEVGLVDRLASLYSESGLLVVGVTSAVGSALLNNHPMSYLNMMALDASSSPNNLRVFAALVGGDLGPRLLPMGSLAGLLWLDILQRHGIDLSVRRFLAVGLLVATPTIAVSLAILSLG